MVLKSGERAIVKVQRPGIEVLVAVDLEALRTAVRWLKRYGPIRRRVDVDALYDEFSRTLYQELDYLAEGRNIERFATDFKDWENHPHSSTVHWELTTRRVLMMEDIGAIKVSDVRAYQAQGVLASEVALTLYDFYLQQVFVNGFFHADPHPGNMFVEPLEDGDFTINVVDFGMVGTLVHADAHAAARDVPGHGDARRAARGARHRQRGLAAAVRPIGARSNARRRRCLRATGASA